ncbi:MAG: ABC transporter ATP-binding protein [Candidatus Aminicenantes bacterium]|nr:ABC transporter ATP-binding protein [Candidatus Aminicenantes bacterium]
MIQVENLSKRFADVLAVNDISFQVEKGMIWGFLGPNGAGKTTTMRILTGYLPPNEGQARINGIDVSSDLAAIKRMVGYLPEVVPVYSELTVKEYLRFVAELYGIERKKRRVAIDRVVERTNLHEVYGRLIKNISRGYRQRLGIAQAIIHEPEVLILDEPTIGLDPAQIIEIREMIRSFKESATVILSSHILAEITQVCDGAVIIKEGRLKATLTRDEWGKNLEISAAVPIEETVCHSLEESFPAVHEARAEDRVLKLEFKETLSDFNPIIKHLVEKDVKIREIKAGLEALYMKVILAEEGRAS